MKNIQQYMKQWYLVITASCLLMFANSSCSNDLEIHDPTSQLPTIDVFQTENTATAAITTLYAKWRDEVLLTGNVNGIAHITGVYSDEFIYTGPPTNSMSNFYNHTLLPTHTTNGQIWNNAYQLIYLCNAAIEGLENTNALQTNFKNQRLAEAKTVRAVTHYYLTQLYGEVPYVTTTDYKTNRAIGKITQLQLLQNILSELQLAQNLFDRNEVTTERIRINYWSASAWIAKVALHLNDFPKTILATSEIINDTQQFQLEANLDNEFSKSSRSAILQLKSKANNTMTNESILIFTTAPPPLVALNPVLVSLFQDNDLRKNAWIGSVTANGVNWYFPRKYINNNIQKYSTIIRLPEMYFLRAEAYAKSNQFELAQKDLNTIRTRAGVAPITNLNTNNWKTILMQDKSMEMFTEIGHRWFDIKRNNLESTILQPIKPNWKDSNKYWPIPESELKMNPNLNPQNQGY